MGPHSRVERPRPQAEASPRAASTPAPKPKQKPKPKPALPQVMSWPLMAVSLLAGLASLLAWRGRQQPDDWASLWVGGLLMDRGQEAHLYDADPINFSAMSGEVWLGAAQEIASPYPHPYVQNPLFARALGWITNVMSFETSVLWLLFFSGAAIVVFVAASYHLWFRATMPWGIAALVTAGVLALPTTINSLWLGQTTPLIVAGVAYGLAASRTRPWLAGILLGIVASIKLTPYALVVVMLFFAYRRRAALWALGTTAVLAVWMFVSVDVAVISAWVDRIRDINQSVLVSGANQSLASTMATDLGVEGVLVSMVRDFPDHVKTIPMVIALGVTIVATAVAWWNRVYRFEILVIGAWLIATSFSAIIWTHYMLMLVTPVMGLAAMSRTRLTSQWPYIGIGALVVLLTFPVTNPIAATPYTGGFVYSGITSMFVALALLLIVGGCHALAVQRGSGVGATLYDGTSAAAAPKLPQPEPMVLFDLVKRWF